MNKYEQNILENILVLGFLIAGILFNLLSFLEIPNVTTVIQLRIILSMVFELAVYEGVAFLARDTKDNNLGFHWSDVSIFQLI